MESQRFTFQGSLVRRMSSHCPQCSVERIIQYDRRLKIIPFRGLFLEVLLNFSTHLLRTVSESQAEPGKLPRYFSRGLHIYSILTRYFAHLLHIFHAVWILHQCIFNTSAFSTPVRKLHQCGNCTEPSQSAEPVSRAEPVGRTVARP